MQTKPQLPYINEIHYDNDGTDMNERIEVAVDAADNAAYYLTVFNNFNTGFVYGSNDPSLATISAPDAFGIKYIVFSISGFSGRPFLGVYMTDESDTRLEILMFGGAGTQFSEYDVGVFEDGTGPSNFSLQRRVGSTTWDSSRQSTFGAANIETTRPSPVAPTMVSPAPPPIKNPTRSPAQVMDTPAPVISPGKERTNVPTKVPVPAPATVPVPVKPPRRPPVPVEIPIEAPLEPPGKCGFICRLLCFIKRILGKDECN